MKSKTIRAYDVLGNIAIAKFDRGTKASEKKKFAEKILRSNNSVKTILEKYGKFKGRLRKMQTRYVAGEKTKEVLYRENGCVFRFNIDKVYFSSRLSNERKEVASMIKKNQKVFVMFAGASPFSIVIAKISGASVYSNEINREANKYGRLNAELNKLKNRIVFVDGDVKRVVEKIIRLSHYPSPRPPTPTNVNVTLKGNDINNFNRIRAKLDKLSDVPRYFDVIVMPRPQLRDSFLKEAFSVSKKGTRIFYYDFCGIKETDLIAEKIQKEAKKYKKKIKILKIKSAGEIAPYKIRVRVDFIVS